MTKLTGILVQVGALIVQMLNIETPLISVDVKWIIAIVVGVLQVIIQGVQAHYNPDGTKATTAYTPAQ